MVAIDERYPLDCFDTNFILNVLRVSVGMNGYSAPFYVCGAIELILSFLLFGLCPSSTARSQQARGRVEVSDLKFFVLTLKYLINADFS